ncbi:CRISPR-associated protein Cas10/Csm1 [Fervidicola ferrireducens]|uniref:CRISPR system single-strand-specific deoxyribonuclease Cas10/Csm1 (subtype III-A) n=2 Tax=Fervidicola ferrireducens TaxID=520764 RepID=A0A140L876_9FIRM|nr:CRISPR-associated protein Cas10/Csm1 [Fervidicola ferrireducens]
MGLMHEGFSKEEKILLLASVLHDIGKFYQRIGDENTKAKIEKEYSTLIKSEGAYGPRHQEWGAYFCEKNVGISEVISAVRNHHDPINMVDLIVAIADKISAYEREDIDEDKGKAKQLISIFSNIELDGIGAEKLHYKEIEPIYKYRKPTDEILSEKECEKRYSGLWKEFEDNFKKINSYDDITELNKLLYLLEEYTSNIPSAFYYSRPDISLWGHLKSTCAIAFCIFREEKDRGKLESIHNKLKRKIIPPKGEGRYFCLVKGDISGIQDFVYDTKMDGATKALRGRSFYISYIMDLIAKYILRTEKLPLTNLLFSGGGHFYLLMPASFMEKVGEYQKFIDEVFFEAHKGRLSVLLGAVEADINDLICNFPEKMDEASREVQHKKTRKFYELVKNKSIFEIKEEPGKNVCPHCGRYYDDECHFCISFEELGEDLIKKRCLYEKHVVPEKLSINKCFDVFKCFGVEVEFLDIPKKGFCYDLKKERHEKFDFDSFIYYLKVPTYMKLEEQSGKIISFDEISKSAKGIKTWGILRGDVDNLGRIFREGLKDNKTISRVLTLSSELSVFFGKYLEDVIKEEYEYCYAIYAGGDDFFFVGPWDRMPYLAFEIRRLFKEYTGHNPVLNISMSFEISPDEKFPLYKVAIEAGEHLDEAKAYEREGMRKNCFSFCGCNIGWEEIDKFIKVKELIVSALNEKTPRSLLNIIYRAVEDSKISERRNEIFKVWKLVYYISRLKQRVRKDAKGYIEEIQDLLLDKGNKLYKFAYVSARWAELETRKAGEGN